MRRDQKGKEGRSRIRREKSKEEQGRREARVGWRRRRRRRER